MTKRAVPLIVRRIISASPIHLFEAFASAEVLQSWFTPSADVSLEIMSYHFAEGGDFRFRFALPDGRNPIVGGKFQTIDKPVKIAMTWQWQPPDPLEDIPMNVTFEFRPQDGKTEVVVIHRGIPSDAACTVHAAGWEGTLAMLEKQI